MLQVFSIPDIILYQNKTGKSKFPAVFSKYKIQEGKTTGKITVRLFSKLFNGAILGIILFRRHFQHICKNFVVITGAQFEYKIANVVRHQYRLTGRSILRNFRYDR